MDKKWLNYRTTPQEVERIGDILDRASYRRFKQVSRKDLAVVLARIYHAGIVDGGKEAVKRAKDRLEISRKENGDAVADFDSDQILEDIMSLPGIGEKIGGRIAQLFEGYAGE